MAGEGGTPPIAPVVTDVMLAAVLKLAREHVALATECVTAVAEYLEPRDDRHLAFADAVSALSSLDQARAKVNTAREGLLRGSEDG